MTGVSPKIRGPIGNWTDCRRGAGRFSRRAAPRSPGRVRQRWHRDGGTYLRLSVVGIKGERFGVGRYACERGLVCRRKLRMYRRYVNGPSDTFEVRTRVCLVTKLGSRKKKKNWPVCTVVLGEELWGHATAPALIPRSSLVPLRVTGSEPFRPHLPSSAFRAGTNDCQ
jgi:hypothetical protein